MAPESIPLALELLGDLLVVVGLYFVFLVYRENTFASAAIGVFDHQREALGFGGRVPPL